MVEETNLDGIIVYKCLKCGWLYRKQELAEKCEQWCQKHKSCNLELIKHTIKLNNLQDLYKGDKS